MNAIKIVVVLAAAVAVSGCASFHTPMKNDAGHVVECRSSGWGWIGAPAAYVTQRQCENDFRDRGYMAFSAVAPPSVTKKANIQPTESVSAEIEKLHEMQKAGALTQEEFAQAKQRLLSR